MVLVGADDIVPMARLSDTTRTGNEQTYADTFSPTDPYGAALHDERMLSDDPYGDLDPVPWMDRRLYLPDLAVGRLVETPAQIISQIDEYIANNGRLDASTAFVSGTEFMKDGATSVSDALTRSLTLANGGTAPTMTQLISDSWTTPDILGALTATNPDVGAIMSHFDHLGGVSAIGAADPAGGFDSAQLAAAIPVGARLLFSMGCHSGLNVDDSEVAAGLGADVAQALVARGAVYLATTGFGYGDQASVGLHERLLTLFADQLTGRDTVGSAVVQAKQAYFGSQGLYGIYDEKALATMVLYGLPNWHLGVAQAPTPPPAPITPSPVPSSTLSTAPFSVTPSFIARTADTGSWYEVTKVGGGSFLPQVTPGRPIQPRLDTDITAANVGGTSLLPAHGALITSLVTGQVIDPFNPAVSAATLDSSADPGEAALADLGFPSRFVTVTTISDPTGVNNLAGIAQRQQLVVIPGQFAAGSNGTTGRQTLFSTVGGQVLYSNSTDYTPPSIASTTGSVTDNGTTTTARFTVDTSDAAGIHRVVVLYDAGAGWVSLDLANGVNGWTGAATVPSGTTAVRFIVQVVDLAGNVAVSSNKGFGFSNPVVQVPPVIIDVPGAPTALSATAANQQLAVSWTAPTSDGGAAISDYVVQYSADGSLFTTFLDGTSSATNATITGLTNGTTYTVRIAAVNAAGNGPTVSTTGTPRTVPNVPTTLVATPGNGKLTVTWTAPPNNGGAAITDYIVKYSANGGTPITFNDGVKSTTGAVITGLVNGTTYTVTVAAVNSAGTGTAVSTTAKPRTVPGVPTALAATPYHSTVALTWAAPTSNGASPITDYVVQYRRTTSTTWLTFKDAVSTTPGAKVTGLVDGVAYSFRVAAKNVAGTSAVSAAVSARPTAVPGPVTVTATPGTRRVTLAWAAPPAGATPVTDYVVQYRRSSSATWLTFTDGVSATRTATVTGLIARVPYSFRVAARNRTGSGPWSAAVGATPR